MSDKNIVIIRNAQSYDFGGGERFPVFLAEVLKEENYNPTIISRSIKLRDFAGEYSIRTVKGWWWKKQEWSGAAILLTPIYLAWQAVLYFYYLFLFQKLQANIVHIQSKDDFIAATLAAHTLNIRIIWTDHADLKHIWRNITVWYKNPIGKIIHRLAKFAHSITVVSKSELHLLSKNLPQQSPVHKKLTVIYNGAFDVAYRYPQKKHTDVVFSFAGRLVYDKGVRELIEAFNSVSKLWPNIHLLIIGDGPDADSIKELAVNNTLITFLGYQSNPFPYLSQSDVFIHPTYHEGFSLALVEASMLSLAIIATDVGGNTEIIKDNETGVLVAPKDSAGIIEKMEIILSDPSLRTKVAKNARKQFVADFQFDNIVRRFFIPLYENKQ